MTQNLVFESALLQKEGRDLDLPSELADLVEAFISGQYTTCLSHKRIKAIFTRKENMIEIDFEAAEPSFLLLAGASLLSIFIQINWTGPFLEWTIGDLVGQLEFDCDEASIAALTLSGEPIYHLTKYAACLYLAKQIFNHPKWNLHDWPSIASWRLRAELVHLRILDEPVEIASSLLTDVEALIARLQTSEDPTNVQDCVAAQKLLIGHYHRLLASTLPSAEKQASHTFLEAAKLATLEYNLTGRMGKRTKFQQEEKAQLVLLARGRQRSAAGLNGQTKNVEPSGALPEAFDLNDDTLLEKTIFTSTVSGFNPYQAVPLSQLDPNNQPSLHPFDQCLLLALSFDHANESPGHGLTSNQVAAFVSRVLEQAKNWSVYSMALLMRSRLEAGRTRTVERGVLQMQSLVDQMKLDSVPDGLKETGAPAEERLQYFHDLALPAKWELERELARRYLNIGAVKSALEIFERLELWEDVVRCYAATEQSKKGIDLIKALLAGEKTESDAVMRERAGRTTSRISANRQAKLWCLLGELESEPQHFDTAWSVSKQTSSAAMRALGGRHFRLAEYDQCSTCLRKALAINPLFVKTWFILGCSDMRRSAWKDAEQAFTRCISLDDEDAESWNNLASIHLRLIDEANTAEDDDTETKSKTVGSHKRAAFTCLAQAIRYSREAWRIWQNYMIVAVDLGELDEACRALRRIIEIRSEAEGDASVDLPTLYRLVDAVIQEKGAYIAAGDARGLAARVEQLFTQILLPRFSSNSQIYSTYARLLNWKGALKESVDFYIKAFQAGPYADASSIHDKTSFLAAAQEVQDLVDVLRNNGTKLEDGPTAFNWKYQARAFLRSFLGRTRDGFEDTSEYIRLTEELAELKAA